MFEIVLGPCLSMSVFLSIQKNIPKAKDKLSAFGIIAKNIYCLNKKSEKFWLNRIKAHNLNNQFPDDEINVEYTFFRNIECQSLKSIVVMHFYLNFSGNAPATDISSQPLTTSQTL